MSAVTAMLERPRIFETTAIAHRGQSQTGGAVAKVVQPNPAQAGPLPR